MVSALQMLERVVDSLHNLQSSSRRILFGDAFIKRWTMIPSTFFYSSPFLLTTTLPKFHLKTISKEKVAIAGIHPLRLSRRAPMTIGILVGG